MKLQLRQKQGNVKSHNLAREVRQCRFTGKVKDSDYFGEIEVKSIGKREDKAQAMDVEVICINVVCFELHNHT